MAGECRPRRSPVTTVVETEPLGTRRRPRRTPPRTCPIRTGPGTPPTATSGPDSAARHGRLPRRAGRRRDPRPGSARGRRGAPCRRDGFGHITDFIEAPPSTFEINAGVYVLSSGFAAMLPERGDHERTTFP
ncbi:hypothetical protein LV779_06870 [Streptomyces thinghirensis]|nr:hypothetical protein [Streptomyces thinghirensis]